MTNEALIASVREQLFVGRSKDVIAKALIEEGGWSAEDVREAFAVVERPHPAAVSPDTLPPAASTSAERLSPPLFGSFSLAWWQRVALAALLVMGAAIALITTVPTLRSLVFGPTPSGEEALDPQPSGTIPNIPLTPEPEGDTLLLRGEDTPTAPATVPPPSTPPATLPATKPASDTTAPSVSVSGPATGTTLSGSAVAVTANASDGVGVVSVQFLLDGRDLGSSDTLAPYSTSWDTTKSANGVHTLSARARDAAGNIGNSASVSVTVNNSVPAPTSTTTPTPTPTPAPTPPAPAPDTTAPTAPTSLSVTAVSSAQLRISWGAATDAVGVVEYRLERCQGVSCTNFAQIATLTALSWDDQALSAGTTYRYRVRAADAALNLSAYSLTASGATQAPAPVPDTTAPTVSVTVPSNGATLSGSVSVAASASDSVGVVGVQFLLDGTNLTAEDTTSPFVANWDTTSATNGTHTLTARARDAAGNQTTSSSVSVTVSNVAPDTTAPTAPTSLSVTVVSASQLNLSWSASTDAVGVTGYKLERCQGVSCTNYAEIATPSATSYQNTTLSAATTYRYRVRATDAAGNVSGYSSAVSGTTQSAAPTSVTVSMLENSYSPLNLTVAVGTTVVFRNDAGTDRWPASDSHPQHNIYPAFDPLRAIPPGGSWSFTFTQAGVWGYHDHIKPSIGGYITVQ